MKVTIRGTIYNTDNADRIAQARYGDDMHDPAYWQATLYRTPRSKKHFLAGVGDIGLGVKLLFAVGTTKKAGASIQERPVEAYVQRRFQVFSLFLCEPKKIRKWGLSLLNTGLL